MSAGGRRRVVTTTCHEAARIRAVARLSCATSTNPKINESRRKPCFCSRPFWISRAPDFCRPRRRPMRTVHRGPRQDTLSLFAALQRNIQFPTLHGAQESACNVKLANLTKQITKRSRCTRRRSRAKETPIAGLDRPPQGGSAKGLARTVRAGKARRTGT
jgi:hypothetical protein